MRIVHVIKCFGESNKIILQIDLSGQGTQLLIQSKFMTDYIENFVLNLCRLLVRRESVVFWRISMPINTRVEAEVQLVDNLRNFCKPYFSGQF